MKTSVASAVVFVVLQGSAIASEPDVDGLAIADELARIPGTTWPKARDLSDRIAEAGFMRACGLEVPDALLEDIADAQERTTDAAAMSVAVGYRVGVTEGIERAIAAGASKHLICQSLK